LSCCFLFAKILFQMRAIKEELGDNEDDEDDLVALERKMQSAGMPPNVWKHAHRELRYFLIEP
jgi:ATP-dependent Lon protease